MSRVEPDDESLSMQDSPFQGLSTTSPVSSAGTTEITRARDRTSDEEVKSSGLPWMRTPFERLRALRMRKKPLHAGFAS